MANFLALQTPNLSDGERFSAFEEALHLAQVLKKQVPNSRIDLPWIQAALFARRNGSGTPIVVDSLTGTWLLVQGVWFHRDGYATGDERRLLARYSTVGAHQLATELDGFFCVVIGDAGTRETIAITDIAGSCHAFYRPVQSGIALSGSSLLLAALGRTHLDPIGFQEFLYTGVVYEDRTCFRDVRKLGPASIYRFRDGALKAREIYWDVSSIRLNALDAATSADALWQALRDAARRVGNVFPNVVCDLTGGYDSRAIAAALLGAQVPFTATVSGPPDSADVRISRGLSESLDIPHRHSPTPGSVDFDTLQEVLALTDGEYDLVDYARILSTHRDLANNFDISINGCYGELARGYWWELLFPAIGARTTLDAGKLSRKRYAAGTSTFPLRPVGSKLEIVEHLASVIQRTNAGLDGAPNTLQMDHCYLRMRMQRWQGRIASSTNQLWPCLSPFMFRGPLEAMLQAPVSSRMRSLLVRRMLSKHQPAVAAYPLEHGYPAMPATLRTLPSFLPVLTHYGQRLYRKAFRRGTSQAGTSDAFSPRLHLWTDETIQSLLEPERMKLTDVIDEAVLAPFIEDSRRADFAHDQVWRRVLTLECALSALASARADIVALS